MSIAVGSDLVIRVRVSGLGSMCESEVVACPLEKVGRERSTQISPVKTSLCGGFSGGLSNQL